MSQSARSLNRTAAVLWLVAILAGCAAGHALHEEGLTLLDEGKTMEGLAKLQEAVKADPENAGFRASLVRNREQAITRMLVAGNNERLAGHPDAAQAAYLWVMKIDPNNARATAGMAALEMDKRHAKIIAQARGLLKKGDLAAASDALRPVLLENPDQPEARALQRKIDELVEKEQSAGPALMAKFRKPISLEFRDANVKMVFEALARTSGINVLLDKDVRPDLKTSIFVKDASVEDTIDLILLQNQLGRKILNESTVFIYPNTPEKNKEYQDLKVRSFHLTNADPKQMLAMIKSLLKTKDVFVHEETNSIVMRDTPEAIRLAEKMIADQDVPEPEVMLEVEVLEVNRNRLSQLGIQWPDQLAFTATGGAAGTANPTLDDLRRINGNSIVTSPALGVTLNLMLQDADTNILASPRIRARNREKASVMIGDRVPVITNAVTPVSTGTPVVTGSVQYLDVGLKLEVQPDIHLDNEVAIKVNMEVSSIVKQVPNTVSGTLAYQIGTRNASTLLQLKDGETQILAGLVNNEDRASANKVPGLGQLPVLGRLFSTHGDNHTRTEIVLSITPHIVGKSRTPDARDSEYWSGTGQTLRDSQLLLRPAGGASIPPKTWAPAAALTPPMSLSWQGPSEAKVGDTITVRLDARSAQGLRDLGLLLNFDPAVLKVVDVTEGDILKQEGAQFSKAVNQADGQIGVSVAGAGNGAPGGEGSLLALTFQVTAPASASSITLSRIAPVRSGGQDFPYSTPPPYSITVGR